MCTQNTQESKAAQTPYQSGRCILHTQLHANADVYMHVCYILVSKCKKSSAVGVSKDIDYSTGPRQIVASHACLLSRSHAFLHVNLEVPRVALHHE